MHWRFVGNLLSVSKLDHHQKGFFETPVPQYQTARRHVTKDSAV
jgi:uncharacterized UPF0160 family protein